MESLEKKPANGGTPAKATVPTMKTQKVTGIGSRRPPISLMSFEWTEWITDPAARNSRALKNACVNRWNRPGV